jgi:hypothetical protein
MKVIYKIKLFFNLLYTKGLKTKTYHARNAEDLFAHNYFKNNLKGRYIDIGAFHPIRNSITYLLHKKGWNGINIDLNKISIDLFNLARPQDINLNLVISDVEKKVNIYQNKDLGVLNTVNLKYASTFLKEFSTKESQSTNLNNVLKNYNSGSKKFELMNIDAEGTDYLVLRGIDFEKYSFKLIFIETHQYDSYTKKESDNIHSLLKSKGYRYLKNLGETAIFENTNWET